MVPTSSNLFATYHHPSFTRLLPHHKEEQHSLTRIRNHSQLELEIQFRASKLCRAQRIRSIILFKIQILQEISCPLLKDEILVLEKQSKSCEDAFSRYVKAVEGWKNEIKKKDQRNDEQANRDESDGSDDEEEEEVAEEEEEEEDEF